MMDELCNEYTAKTPLPSTSSKLFCTPFKSAPKPARSEHALFSSQSSNATPYASSTAVRPATPSSAKASSSTTSVIPFGKAPFIKSNKVDKKSSTDVSLQLVKQQETLTNTVSGIHEVLKEMLAVQRERLEIDRKRLDLEMARSAHL
jgi:hypothetical protein